MGAVGVQDSVWGGVTSRNRRSAQRMVVDAGDSRVLWQLGGLLHAFALLKLDCGSGIVTSAMHGKGNASPAPDIALCSVSHLLVCCTVAAALGLPAQKCSLAYRVGFECYKVPFFCDTHPWEHPCSVQRCYPFGSLQLLHW